MPEKLREIRPPNRVLRALLRFPILLFRIGLGGLFGRRLLLLNHIGRKSGLARQAVLEVVTYYEDSDTYVVNAGFGKTSDWFLNLEAHPDASIQIGRHKMDVRAELLTKENGAEAMLRFSRENPLEARFIWLMGYRVDGSEQDWRALGEQLTFMALRPRLGP